MDLKNIPGKINFVIALFEDFSSNITGGLVAMHKLAYEIANRGHNVYIFCKPEFYHENISVISSSLLSSEGFVNNYSWDPFNFFHHNTVSVYPQIHRGNSFNTSHVVRWIMYDTEKEIEDFYGEQDVYFNCGTYKTFRQDEMEKLSVVNYYFDLLYIENTGRRKGFCHIVHKHTPPGGLEIFNHLNSKDLSGWKEKGGYEYLRKELNQYEYLLTYDQKSFYTLAAGLCGCKSVILNAGPSYEFAENAWSKSEEYKEIMTPTEYRLKNPEQMYGVAYGWDDIQWANNTISMVRGHLEEMEKINQKTIDKFIKYWEKKLIKNL